jgi:hypothetical protein
MKYAAELDSYDMIYTPSFMKIGRGVQETLRVHLGSLRGHNIGISEGRDL